MSFWEGWAKIHSLDLTVLSTLYKLWSWGGGGDAFLRIVRVYFGESRYCITEMISPPTMVSFLLKTIKNHTVLNDKIVYQITTPQQMCFSDVSIWLKWNSSGCVRQLSHTGNQTLSQILYCLGEDALWFWRSSVTISRLILSGFLTRSARERGQKSKCLKGTKKLS